MNKVQEPNNFKGIKVISKNNNLQKNQKLNLKL